MITIHDYATKDPSGQTAAFIAWVTTEAGMTFKTNAAQDAFERGLYMGVQGYKLFQAANREAAAKAKPVPKPRAKAKPVRKPRAKKAAAEASA